MNLHRFHVQNAAPGTMALPDDARQHATRVIRLGVGDPLLVFDAGAEFRATIAAIEKHRVLIDVSDATPGRPERLVALQLIMSPLKGDLTELVIQKATELGVASITPTIFERTDAVARREPTSSRTLRWSRVAANAAEQSGRCAVPRVDPVAPLGERMGLLGPAREGEVRIFAAEPRIEADHSGQTSGTVRSVIVAVGPAGGLSPADMEALSAAGFTPERFAMHTLRSETACIAALAVLGNRYPESGARS